MISIYPALARPRLATVHENRGHSLHDGASSRHFLRLERRVSDPKPAKKNLLDIDIMCDNITLMTQASPRPSAILFPLGARGSQPGSLVRSRNLFDAKAVGRTPSRPRIASPRKYARRMCFAAPAQVAALSGTRDVPPPSDAGLGIQGIYVEAAIPLITSRLCLCHPGHGL